MQYLFFDTETSGLPKRWDAPVTEVSNWPRLVQLAWIVCSAEGDTLETGYHLVYPDGFSISPRATEKHGITTAHAREHGEPLIEVMDRFSAAFPQVDAVVGHNVSFDLNVVGAEFLRLKRVDPLSLKRSICTMKESTKYCRLPGNYGYKWPTLAELHAKLFGASFADAHDALADCDACRRCFFRLRELSVLKA